MTTSKRHRHDSYVELFKANESLKSANALLQKKNVELIHNQAEADRTWADRLASMQKAIDDKNEEYARLVNDFKKVVETNNQLEGMNRNQEVELIRIKNHEANLEKGCNLAEAEAEFFRDRCKALESHFWTRLAYRLHIMK